MVSEQSYICEETMLLTSLSSWVLFCCVVPKKYVALSYIQIIKPKTKPSTLINYYPASLTTTCLFWFIMIRAYKYVYAHQTFPKIYSNHMIIRNKYLLILLRIKQMFFAQFKGNLGGNMLTLSRSSKSYDF